jgi:multicomponent Na+:H+ antiporter subunit A
MYFLTGATVAVGMLSVAVAAIVGVRPFFGKAADTPKHPHEAPVSLWLGPALLAVLSLALGLFPDRADTPLLAPAQAATVQANEPAALKLALWHGWNPALALSGTSLAGGVGLFLLRGRLRGLLRRVTHWGPARLYDLGLDGLNGLARLQTRLLQSGYLRYYLLTILATAVALVGYTLVSRGRLAAPANWSDIRFYEAGLVALIALAILATVRSRSRLAAIAALGVVGYSVALIFVLYGAPDLAMTQFLIETLTVILFVLVFYHLPSEKDVSKVRVRLRDAAVAMVTGSIMTALVLIAVQTDLHPTISGYFFENSVPEAHGRNVVNVILVDFRGLDTLGEITVLAVAAVGVYALLKLRPAPPAHAAEEKGQSEGGEKA